MTRNLRSLIHEHFSEDLRFEIELLTRRRDLANKEKVDALIQLLEAHPEVGEYTKLGPGTNRYAFRLSGYAVKVAMDHDGKIDNLKEFKMAKRLYPYVSKTYEVSENGTLLVAEYVPPFASYFEMQQHADQIRAILKELSSVYLIGDVGVTAKNYANWGLRVGTNDPVCLDFAYVYSVSSELFLCRSCKAHAMLVPDENFTELHCPNKQCGKRVTFEMIRARIGNDMHRHEIGDLSEEGYRLEHTDTVVELDENRSNYLAKQKKTKAEKKTPPTNVEQEEEVSMSMTPEEFANVMKGRPFEPMNLSGITFTIPDAEEAPKIEFTAPDKPVFQSVLPSIGRKAEILPVEAPVQLVETQKDVSSMYPTDDDAPCIDPNDPFRQKVFPAVSRLSNEIGRWARETNVYKYYVENLSKGCPVLVEDEFYKSLQNAVFRSLIQFLAFDEEYKENAFRRFVPSDRTFKKSRARTLIFLKRYWDNREINQANGSDVMEQYADRYPDFCGIQMAWYTYLHHRIQMKMHIDRFLGMQIADWITNIWSDNQGTSIVDHEMIFTIAEEYQEDVANHSDIVPDDLVVHVDRTQKKFFTVTSENYRNSGKTYEFSMELLPVRTSDIEEHPAVSKLYVDGTCVGKYVYDGVSIMDRMVRLKADYAIFEDVHFEDNPYDVPEESTEGPAPTPEPSGISPFSMELEPLPTEEENTDERNAMALLEDEDTRGICIEYYPDGSMECVRVISADEYGPVAIPFYIDGANESLRHPGYMTPSLTYEGNGMWDWLCCMTPDLIFRTKNPEAYLRINQDEVEDNMIRVAVLDEEDETYTIGIFFVDRMETVDSGGNRTTLNDPAILQRIFHHIKQSLQFTAVSHLRVTMLPESEALLVDEKDIYEVIRQYCDDSEEGMGMDKNQEAAVAEEIIGSMHAEKEAPVVEPEAPPIAPDEAPVPEEATEVNEPVPEEVEEPQVVEEVLEESTEEEPAAPPTPEASTEGDTESILKSMQPIKIIRRK